MFRTSLYSIQKRRSTAKNGCAAASTPSHSASKVALTYRPSGGVQKHVAVLERAGLVVKRRRGREQLVRCNVDTVRRAQHLLDQLESIWRDRLDRFERLLDDDTHPRSRPTSS